MHRLPDEVINMLGRLPLPLPLDGIQLIRLILKTPRGPEPLK